MARKVLAYIFIICFAFFISPLKANAEAVSKHTIKELIVKHAKEMGLDPALALSIAKAESGFNHEKKSRYGAVGVFQLMPSTARKMGFNPYHVHDNIKGGLTYYKMMYKMFGSTELALAAYNAGPGNVRKYNGVPPFGETKKFISIIMENYNSLKLNPDPAIAQYENAIKEISNKMVMEVIKEKNIEEKTKEAEEEIIDEQIAEEIRQAEFRIQQEAMLKAFLSEQGI